MTLVSVTAYHSFGGEVEASNTPTIRRLTPSCRHQLPRIARVFSHESDDDEVEVTVWFGAGEMVLEFRGARKVKEIKSEPDDAA